MRQIVLDTETTGLETAEGHRIIEVGAVELIDRRYTGNNYHQFINPNRDIDKGAVAVHGITNDFLIDKPRFSEILEDLMCYVEGAELIIHNAPFDVGFLDYELALAGSHWRKIKKHCQILDTLVMARQLHPGQRNSLDALCKRYSVDNSNREFHGALLDAELLADVYLLMTGGQGYLFSESSQEGLSKAENASHQVFIAEVSGLRVIRATADELSKHQEKMGEILVL